MLGIALTAYEIDGRGGVKEARKVKKGKDA